MASRLRDFTLINTPTFYGSKVDEDSQMFIDEVVKFLDAMDLKKRRNWLLTNSKLWLMFFMSNGSMRGP